MTSASTEAQKKSGDGTTNATTGTMPAHELRKLDAYWRASNYLSVGQIYLLDNPLSEGFAEAGAHQATIARPLGDVAGPEHDLRSPQQGHQEG